MPHCVLVSLSMCVMLVAWIIGGVFALLSGFITCWQVYHHIKYNSHTQLRRYIIRILFMVNRTIKHTQRETHTIMLRHNFSRELAINHSFGPALKPITHTHPPVLCISPLSLSVYLCVRFRSMPSNLGLVFVSLILPSISIFYVNVMKHLSSIVSINY